MRCSGTSGAWTGGVICPGHWSQSKNCDVGSLEYPWTRDVNRHLGQVVVKPLRMLVEVSTDGV